MEVFELTSLSGFPRGTLCLDRSDSPINTFHCCNIAEAWRKRRYVASFVSKLSDSESEAAESETWIELARRCSYRSDETAARLEVRCEEILSQLSLMIRDADRWCLPPGTR